MNLVFAQSSVMSGTYKLDKNNLCGLYVFFRLQDIHCFYRIVSGLRIVLIGY